MSEVKKVSEMSYEERMSELNDLLGRLDNAQTPIDELATDTRRGVALITSMKEDLKKVEMEVKEVFDGFENE